MNQHNSSESFDLSSQSTRSPASGYSKSILSAIKDIPYEQIGDCSSTVLMVQSPQTMESSIYDGKIVKDESQICETNSAPIQTETDNLQQHRNKTVTTFKMKVGGHAKLVEGKPGKVFLAQNQRRERRSISCDTTPTMSPVKTSTSKQLLQSQRTQSINLTNVTDASVLSMPGCSLASSQIGSCISVQSAASTTANVMSKRSPSLTSSICSKDEKSQSGQPKICFADCVQALNACDNGDLEALKKLIKKNPNIVNYQYPYCYRYSCLHIAAKVGNMEIVNFLIAIGANLNARDDTWSTPLHLCAQAGHLEVVEQLKTLGAKTNIRNANGKLYSDYMHNLNFFDSKKPKSRKHHSNFEMDEEIDSLDESIGGNCFQQQSGSNVTKLHNYSFHSFRKPFTRAVHGLLHRK